MTVEKLIENVEQKNWPNWKVENLLGYFEDNSDLVELSAYEIAKLISGKLWEIRSLNSEVQHLEGEIYILQDYLRILDEDEEDGN